MNDKFSEQESFRTFQLMNELEDGSTVSQRELASRLGIAVGLVNSYLKNFVTKGFVRVKNYPRNRYAYLLTPKGFAEKSRLAYQHLNYFTNLYTFTRQDYSRLFLQLKSSGVSSVAFCGVDEVAEIAYLSLQESGLKLDRVVDDRSTDKFFEHEVGGLNELDVNSGHVVITSLKRALELEKLLFALGFKEDYVFKVQ